MRLRLRENWTGRPVSVAARGVVPMRPTSAMLSIVKSERGFLAGDEFLPFNYKK